MNAIRTTTRLAAWPSTLHSSVGYAAPEVPTNQAESPGWQAARMQRSINEAYRGSVRESSSRFWVQKSSSTKEHMVYKLFIIYVLCGVDGYGVAAE